MRTEGPGDRVGDGELTERTHDEINRNAADDIRQEHRWAGEFDSGRRSQKQTDADRAAYLALPSKKRQAFLDGALTGKRADLVVLSRDILSAPPEEIL